MKKSIAAFMLPVLFSALSNTAIAQSAHQEKPLPKWVSDKGYWLIVGNLKTPKTNVVNFYNNSHILVYTETLKGLKLNVKRKKVCMRLKQVLDEALAASDQWLKSEQLVKNIFNKKQK